MRRGMTSCPEAHRDECHPQWQDDEWPAREPDQRQALHALRCAGRRVIVERHGWRSCTLLSTGSAIHGAGHITLPDEEVNAPARSNWHHNIHRSEWDRLDRDPHCASPCFPFCLQRQGSRSLADRRAFALVHAVRPARPDIPERTSVCSPDLDGVHSVHCTSDAPWSIQNTLASTQKRHTTLP
jgi:hypothetical protein